MTTPGVRVGIALLPEVDPAHDDRWARVEAYGFAHAWCLDHLAWRTQADEPWFATVPVLAAAALRTSRITLGTFVASANFRHPVPFSKELMTLDVMSGGRLLVGMGAGGAGFDAEVLGTPPGSPRERADRYEEFVTLLDVLLTRPRTSWSGAHFSAVDARTIPGPLQRPRPPFVVAANGPRGMRLALRHGQGWVTSGLAPHGTVGADWWAGVAGAAERFADVAAASGGPPPGFGRYLDMGVGAGPATSAAKVLDDLRHAADLGFTDVVMPWLRERDLFAGSESVVAEVAGHLQPGGRLPGDG